MKHQSGIEALEQLIDEVDYRFTVKYGVSFFPLYKTLANLKRASTLAYLYASRNIPRLGGRISFSGLTKLLQIKTKPTLVHHLERLQSVRLVVKITGEGEKEGTYRAYALTDSGTRACEEILGLDEHRISESMEYIRRMLSL